MRGWARRRRAGTRARSRTAEIAACPTATASWRRGAWPSRKRRSLASPHRSLTGGPRQSASLQSQLARLPPRVARKPIRRRGGKRPAQRRLLHSNADLLVRLDRRCSRLAHRIGAFARAAALAGGAAVARLVGQELRDQAVV